MSHISAVSHDGVFWSNLENGGSEVSVTAEPNRRWSRPGEGTNLGQDAVRRRHARVARVSGFSEWRYSIPMRYLECPMDISEKLILELIF